MDPFSIVATCIDVALFIMDIKEKLEEAPEQCNLLMQDVAAMKNTLIMLQKVPPTILSSKSAPLQQLSVTLVEIKTFLEAYEKKKKSVFGKAKNAMSAAYGSVGTSIDAFRARLQLLLPMLHLAVSVDGQQEVYQMQVKLDNITKILGEQKREKEKNEGSLDDLYLPDPMPMGPQSYLDRRFVLGTGSFGATERRRNHRDGNLYAVKVVRMGDARAAAVAANLKIEAILGEALVLESLCHTNIVRYFLSYSNDTFDTFNIVMELCTSGSIADRVGEEYDEKQLLRWFTQITNALCYLHSEKRIYHRDIKPENILVTTGDVVKLIDFGLSVAVQLSSAAQSKVGSMIYMSYEK